MYTTACEACRKVRAKCIRPSRGYDQNEICERCQVNALECSTVRRRVGRQAGVKNRKRKASTMGDDKDFARSHSPLLHRDPNHLPNPLNVLASEAARRHFTPEPEDTYASEGALNSIARTSGSILDKYSDWVGKIHPVMGRQVMKGRLDELLADRPWSTLNTETTTTFSGRMDMSRPDAAPEHDVISLQLISMPEAQRLFDALLKSLRNGSMHFDPRLHTIAFVRARSSFLLATMLSVASTFKDINPSAKLHSQLVQHAAKLEAHVRLNNLKSIEICQGFLLLASWSEIQSNMCRDKTWLYVSQAIAMVTELRLDSPLPYCIQMDPEFGQGRDELLVRNAHRVCLMVYIHDRNMAMVAGRFPVFPESSVTSPKTLDVWGKHPRAHLTDEPSCASVSLRKLVMGLHHTIGQEKGSDYALQKAKIDSSYQAWRVKWTTQITSECFPSNAMCILTEASLEYEIIAKFSELILCLTLMQRMQYPEDMERSAKADAERLAFEVVCVAIAHYKSWTSILNSATFDTCMVGFAAHYILQSIKRSPSTRLSDWSVFRLATLLELVAELEKQANGRHQLKNNDTMSVVDAMAKQVSFGIQTVLAKKTSATTPLINGSTLDSASVVSASTNLRVSREDEEIWKVMTATAAQHSGQAYDSVGRFQIGGSDSASSMLPAYNPPPSYGNTVSQDLTGSASQFLQQSPFSDHDPFGLNSNTIPFFAERQLEDFLATTMPDGTLPTTQTTSTAALPWGPGQSIEPEFSFSSWLGSNGMGDGSDLGIFSMQ